MKVSKNSVGGLTTAAFFLNLGPYRLANAGESDEVNPVSTNPGLPSTLLPAPPVGRRALVIGRNVSTAGQIIRVGASPSFATPSGMPLFPGEEIQLENIAIPLQAVADVAGARLARFVLWSAFP